MQDYFVAIIVFLTMFSRIKHLLAKEIKLIMEVFMYLDMQNAFNLNH